MICVQCLPGQNVGINTDTPERQLHVKGLSNQFLRIETNSAAEAGIEFVNWNISFSMDDWKVVNDNGKLRINHSTSNFISTDIDVLSIDDDGDVGIKVSSALSPIHIGTGGDATNSSDGYLVVGSKSGFNLSMDQNEINARNNGIVSTLRFQQGGGTTNIGQGGGHVFIGSGGGRLGIGMTLPPAKVSADAMTFQLSLNNPAGFNKWYIGATNADWAVGDNQLIFSPAFSSSAARFRLRAISDNNGSQAPVAITSAGSQTLLIDGNEIDGLSDPVYINYNSHQNTYINPTGGNVGIGSANAPTTLLVDTEPTSYALRLQHDNNIWNIHPFPAINKLAFVIDGVSVAQVDGTSGSWIALSDKNFKTAIRPLTSVIDKVRALDFYSYQFKNDSKEKQQVGTIAQELEHYFPEMVSKSEEQYFVAYQQLAVIALKALQEQQLEIDALTDEIGALVAAKQKITSSIR
jgi:hypothetical protein